MVLRLDKVDCIIIGAGIVGLAVARSLSMHGREVVVLEKAQSVGSETSARNSEVIHGGLYYPPGSLKAQTCVAGKEALYTYCKERAISHQQCGKLIVATSEADRPKLDVIHSRALQNGIDDLVVLSPEDVHALEPELSCVGALLSPSTGIVDSHGLMLALRGDLEDQGGAIAFACEAARMAVKNNALTIETAGDDVYTIEANWIVNCAGLWASDTARKVEGLSDRFIPNTSYAKGNYFACSPGPRFNHLVYPTPDPHGLGVHATLDLSGQVRFGPDVEWVDELDYRVEVKRADVFYEAVRRYWPKLADNALQPDYAGIRPKLPTTGNEEQDFIISGPGDHGVSGLINFFGIESPGLTSALALAEIVTAEITSSA